MHDRLVVGFDGSDTARNAVHWAAAEAARRGASVHVASSYALPPVMDYYGLGIVSSATQLNAVKANCHDDLALVVAEMARLFPGVGFDLNAADTSTVAMLVDAAEKADLLVVGSSGAGATKAFLLGSVTAAVLHDSPCPVVVVPLHSRPLSGRVVVGVDGSGVSDSAVLWASDEADRRGAELVVIHAWEYPYRPTSAPDGSGYDYARVDAALIVDHAVELAQDRCGAKVTGELRECGATQALLDASETADLVIVGSRGRGGFRSMVLGSVAQTVAAHAATPVVVIRWPGGM